MVSTSRVLNKTSALCPPKNVFLGIWFPEKKLLTSLWCAQQNPRGHQQMIRSYVISFSLLSADFFGEKSYFGPFVPAPAKDWRPLFSPAKCVHRHLVSASYQPKEWFRSAYRVSLLLLSSPLLPQLHMRHWGAQCQLAPSGVRSPFECGHSASRRMRMVPRVSWR